MLDITLIGLQHLCRPGNDVKMIYCIELWDMMPSKTVPDVFTLITIALKMQWNNSDGAATDRES